MSYQANKLIPGPTGPTGPTGVGPGPTGPTGPTGGIDSVQSGTRTVIDNTDPLNPIVDWVPTTYAVRNVTGNIPVLEEVTVCTTPTGVTLTLPTAAVTADENRRHTIINRGNVTLAVTGTGGDGFGNIDVVGTVYILPGEGMTFIADGTNTWLYEQDRTMYDFITVPTGTGIGNVTSITIENMFFNRVGNVVHFAGAVTIVETTTGPGVLTTFSITVPKYGTSTTFASIYDLCGTGAGYTFFPPVPLCLSADTGVAAGMITSYYNSGFDGETFFLHGSYQLL